MRIRLVAGMAAAAALALPATVFAHDKFDHPFAGDALEAGPTPAFQSGGHKAKWEFVTTLVTGNPHTDVDFFGQDGETFASVGTLGTGGNAGGQTIVQLTQGNRVEPRYVSSHPSASCLSNPAATTGLQHDVEATPKSRTILNTRNPSAVRQDTELLLDATDAEGRCHDQGDPLGVTAPQGGLEIVDVTDPANPVEIGLVSHIGESHTVNVDPKRPHIVYSVTSDAVNLDAQGNRLNEDPNSSERFDLDGFEVLDISTCMGFPEGTPVAVKRRECRPEVFRYRYPSTDISIGHTRKNAVYGCHELEIYPEDRLTCGSGNAMILFDLARAFRHRGTLNDFTDDVPRGTPLPCAVRDSSSDGLFATGAKVTDCVRGENAEGEAVDLTVPGWIDIGSPSLRNVEHVGSAHHQGRGAADPGTGLSAFDSTEDIDFDHEAELTHSRNFVLATDERGGGILPPGATCTNDPVDFREGNGGLHAYAVDRLDTAPPPAPALGDNDAEAFDPYARTPAGRKAIYRAPIRTGAQATICTAHVFQQIPGQNRIFMGWYSQGTQVVDYIERSDGTIRFKEAGYFIPAEANQWVSHVFKVKKRPNGRFTYWGMTGDFRLSDGGRNAMDVYRVTLPAPPRPR